jgi:hypothetical protein
MNKIILLVVLMAFFIPALAATGTDNPNLVGNWTGIMKDVNWEKHADWALNQTDIFGPGSEITLTIDEQNGNRFIGKKTPQKAPKAVEVILGIMASDNKSLSIVDEDGYYWANMLSPTQMELIYQEVDIEGMIIASGILNKK